MHLQKQICYCFVIFDMLIYTQLMNFLGMNFECRLFTTFFIV
jgi:hypothetical protein